MSAGLWIAERYSFARKRFRVINIISVISLFGITLGVSTLLVVMSVLNGFQKLARDLFLTIDSPVQIVPIEGRSMVVSDSLLAAIATIRGVASVQPFAEGQAILSGMEKSELVVVKGLTEAAQRQLQQETKRNVPYFTAESISAGELLACRLRLVPFGKVKIFSPELIALGLESLSQPYLLPAFTLNETSIASIFSVQKMFDDRYVLASSAMARKILLFGPNHYSGIDIRGHTDGSDETMYASLRQWLADNHLQWLYRIRPLEEKYRDIFAVMQLEKWASFTVLMLVILVAGLSLAGSLAMTVIDKQRELFYLRCLGLEKEQFMMIFILEGGLTGLAGTAAGSLIAWLLCRAQELYGLVELPSKSAFIIQAYPVSMKSGDFLVVGLSTILVCLLVSLYPARKAAAIATSHSLDMKIN